MSGDSGLNERVERAFRRIWPNGREETRRYLTPMMVDFARSDCCDRHFLDEFESGDRAKVAARIWEAMLYSRFRDLGWAISGSGIGPDFLLNDSIYVEAVAAHPGDPAKSGLPREWQERTNGKAFRVPIDEMLLRWTTALKEKKDKHAADTANSDGRADSTKPFVIAVNACLLGPDTHGIGGVPLAVMAVLPFGNPTARIDVKTGELKGEWHLAWQDAVLKQNGIPIPTDNFLNEDYGGVSALIGCSNYYVDEADQC
jgi:type I restriction enzyme S subunit